jgi:hypothetical protein
VVKRFALRLEDDLHEKLVKLSEREHRSLHSQIIYLLEQSVKKAQDEGKLQE